MNNIVLNKLGTIVVILLGIALLYVGSIKLFFLFFPFLVGIFISKLITPMVSLLHERLKIPNNISTAIMILTVVGLSSYTVYSLALLLIYYIGELAKVLPDWANAIIVFGSNLSIKFQNMFIQLPFDPATYISKGAAGLISDLSAWATKYAGRGVSLATSLPGVLVSVIITILSAFFFTKDRKKIEVLIDPFKRKYFTENPHYLAFKQDVLSVIFGYIKAQGILMSITFSICTVGLLIIGVPNAIPIALGIGFVDALPIFGPATVYMPWIISVLITGNTTLALKLFVLYLTTTITRQIFEPKVVGTQIGIHPLLTLTALYLGVKLLGAPGLILGPFTMVTLLATYRRYFKKETTSDNYEQ